MLVDTLLHLTLLHLALRRLYKQRIQTMNSKFFFYYSLGLSLLLWAAPAISQSAAATQPATQATPQYSVQGSLASAAPPPQQGTAVSYASVTQLNGLLAKLEATSKTTQADLTKLRIERWK